MLGIFSCLFLSLFLPQTESRKKEALTKTMNDYPAGEAMLQSELGIIKSDVGSIKSELSRVRTAGNFSCVAVDALV